jgi:beta-lactamase class A
MRGRNALFAFARRAPESIFAPHVRYPSLRLFQSRAGLAGVIGGTPMRAGAQTAADTLRARLAERVAAVPGAVAGVFYRDLGNRAEVTLSPDSVFHAASTMKVPVMIEVFREVERGGLALDQPILLLNNFSSIVDGSLYSLSAGDDSDSSLYGKIGSRVPVRQLVDLMITESSNLAANTLIELVGAARADSTAHELGARSMRVLRGVEDGKAFARGLNNVTTARDLAELLTAIEMRRAASPASCNRMIAVLERQQFNSEIPAGLPPYTRVAHKTGEITGVLHDAAIVYPDHRAPYVLVILTRSIPEQRVARQLIVDLTRLVHGYAMRRR